MHGFFYHMWWIKILNSGLYSVVNVEGGTHGVGELGEKTVIITVQLVQASSERKRLWLLAKSLFMPVDDNICKRSFGEMQVWCVLFIRLRHISDV